MNEKTQAKDSIKHIFSIVCRSSSIDFQTNVLSVFDVLEYINLNRDDLEKNPSWKEKQNVFLPLAFEMITLWSREGVNDVLAKFRIDIVSPYGEVLKSTEHPLAFNQGKKRTRVRLRFNGLPIVSEGVYQIRVSLKHKDDEFKSLSMVPIEVQIVDQKVNT